MDSRMEEVTQNLLELANKVTGARTLFISKISSNNYSILKVINNNGICLEEGAQFPVGQTL